MTSRSRFYVETPRDPSQRHSMFVNHSELEQRQDLSSNSSSATLPSASGSVDRLTGLEEKKSPGFFTLKPKSSFSLRPFFKSSSSSLISLSPSKRRKAILERRDSYVQTEEIRPVLGEVGVQTLNASTVDVPVQTSLEAWEEGDSYGHKRLAYASARTSPFWSRPSVASSTLSSPFASKYVPKDPLASPKLVKYAVPGDSQKPALCNPSAVSSVDVNNRQPLSPPHQTVSSNVPVKYFSVKELTSNPISLSVDPQGKEVSKVHEVVPSEEKSPQIPRSPLADNTPVKSEETDLSKYEIVVPEESATVDKQTEVSDNLNQSVIQNVDLPISVLKIERTDSPSKRTKTVHFDLPNSDLLNPISDNSNKPRNIDKDFEALLRDLNVLTEDGDGLKISFDGFPYSKAPTPTLLSPNLKSALDALKQDFLAPIPENSDECGESEESNKLEDSTLTDKDKNNLTTLSVDVSSKPSTPRKLLTRTLSEYENVHKNDEIKNNKPVTPTSLSIFTSANSGSSVETDSLEENVYNNVIEEENLVKTVPLPILPSFFEPPSQAENSESTQIVEYNNDKEPSSSLSDNQPLSAMPLESDFERNRLSRSSSRSSTRSASKTDFEESLSKFDSCENLDQLEEEIIRSLYSPDEGKLEENVMQNPELPLSESFQNSGTTATHMRRVILDQLLSGKNVEAIVPNYPIYQRTHSVPDVSSKYKPVKKYTAVLTRMENVDSDFPPFQDITSEDIRKAGNGYDPNSKPESVNQNMRNKKNETNSIKFEPIKKTSIFLIPEGNRSNTEFLNNSNPEISPNANENIPILEVRRSSWTPHQTTSGLTPSNSPSMKKSDSPTLEKENTSDNKSGQCDFTSCLKPSKIQNSPFMAKINTRSMSPCNFSQLPPLQNNFTSGNNLPKRNNSSPKQPETVGECVYANCLRPSQVQNSLFTAELSEITAGKSPNSLRAASPLTVRSNSPFTIVKSTSVELPSTPLISREIRKSSDSPVEPVKHKSEFLITLKTTEKHSTDAEPVTEAQNLKTQDNINNNTQPAIDKSSDLDSQQETQPSEKSEISQSHEPLPPPPPPLPSEVFSKSNLVTKISDMDSAAKPVIKEQECNLVNANNPSDSKAQLEERIDLNESQWRNSEDDKDNDKTPCAEPLLIHNEQKPESIVNGSSHYTTHGNRSENGNIRILPEHREHMPSSLNGQNNENVHHGSKLSFSPNTIITDEPPPPGAVLLDKKVTVEGDKVHTDRYFAIPVKEVLKEKTSTTKFIPAPPKYEGIGPTEDGIPTGLRNSVKKENMHNWYKTMFKSLHKADCTNESEEYIIGYTSEPETSRKDMVLRKKSSTLDSRKHDINSNVKPNFPPSAKSSIEVYNVRPRLIEDYEPGYSSVTDDVPVISRRYLPTLNTPKPSYEFKNGYESDTTITRKRDQPEALSFDQQKQWYREVQKGGEIPQFGLGKQAPEKPLEPSIGPVPPPPLNYNGPASQQAVRPLTLPADYTNQNGNGYCQQMNGIYEMQMRNALHSEMQQRMSPSSNQLSPPNRSMIKSPSKSPDIRISAQALFDFKAESPKEIPLKKGDLVVILRQLDKNWYEGEHRGVVGIFPISYVEIVPPEHASTPIKPRTDGLGKALFDFMAQTPIELTVRKGDTMSLIRRVDANWFEANFNNKRGIIPVSYVQVLQEPIERSLNSPSQKSYSVSPNSESKEKLQVASSVSPSSYSQSSISPLPQQNINERRKFSSKKSSSLVEPIMYRALYSYSPQNSDELELQEGDSVYVVEMCDDGWYVGTSVRTGIFGIFPGNYVEKAC